MEWDDYVVVGCLVVLPVVAMIVLLVMHCADRDAVQACIQSGNPPAECRKLVE